MKKFLLIILSFFIFLSCSETITESPTVEETSLSKKPPKPPKPDPEPPVPLNLSNSIVEIVSFDGDNKVIEVLAYDGATYNKTWSFYTDKWVGGVDIGDVDSDGEDELVVSVRYQEGKGRNKKYIVDLLIFENGDVTEPSRSAMVNGEISTRDIVIGDANNDGANEILIGGRNNLRVWDGTGPSEIWTSENIQSEFPWSVQIEDADSDGKNEIIYSSLTDGIFVVYNYLGSNTWGNRVVSEKVPGAVDIVDFGDIDNDGIMEAVGGGNQNVIFVWEYVSGNFVLSFTSEDLGGFTQGVEVADFDNDGIDEIATGTASSTNNGDFYIFEYNGTTYVQTFYEMISGNVNAIKSADVDSDGVQEILIAAVPGKIVYDYSSGYVQVYSASDAFLMYIQGG